MGAAALPAAAPVNFFKSAGKKLHDAWELRAPQVPFMPAILDQQFGFNIGAFECSVKRGASLVETEEVLIP